MAEPSYKSSTLSLVFIGANIFYATFALLIAGGVIFAKVPLDTAKELIVWPTVLWSNITTSYFTARKVNGEKSANGPPQS